MAMISIVNVSKLFGNTAAVKGISFEVQEGENFILLGTSGCGKTTTLRMINRLTAISSGTILVNGKSISDQSPEILRRGMGYVLQHNSLFPHYTIAENIAVVPRLLKWNKSKIETRTTELLGKLHLPADYLYKYPHQLSGGEAQRVNLARALVADPPILLMDEPFGALDPLTRVAIRKEFSALDEFKRKTIMMVTHDVLEAFELGNRICIMDKGKIMQIGTPAELLFHPVNDFVKNFLAGAHMQLALMVTTINDLWSYLKPGNDDDVLHRPVVNSNTSLWNVMEKMTTENDTTLNVHNDKNNEIKNVSIARLLEAFTTYKKHF
jgi:osmoprotectant transport system ATP-binding protein